MDASGRLHMPGFVGGTFEETGLTKKKTGSGPTVEANAFRPDGTPVSRQVRRQLERAALKRGGQQDRRQGVKT